MEQNPFTIEFDLLPDHLPVFPLINAVLLPAGHLPLNVFEPRYMRMIDDALATDRLIGIIQPTDETATHPRPHLRRTGCAGKIIEFSETADGRYIIKLAGLYRFNLIAEIDQPLPYRIVTVDWQPYEKDSKAFKCLNLDRAHLNALLRLYFSKQEMICDWEAVDGAADDKLITCLAMICPFEPQERQALLEAACCKTRADLFMSMLELAVQGRPRNACH
ncbi:MAG: LON peptidase substrate-binding domain-containing protein [Alphaproteobacteria bacterium]|nr:LON peptidase substrate-binding domain-containing protein [Alphaproteobacteria bacterium]